MYQVFNALYWSCCICSFCVSNRESQLYFVYSPWFGSKSWRLTVVFSTVCYSTAHYRGGHYGGSSGPTPLFEDTSTENKTVNAWISSRLWTVCWKWVSARSNGQCGCWIRSTNGKPRKRICWETRNWNVCCLLLTSLDMWCSDPTGLKACDSNHLEKLVMYTC